MVRSFVFKDGRLVSRDLQEDVLRLMLYEDNVQIWVDMEDPTPAENQLFLESIFAFHPLAVEDCVNISELPKVDDYDSYIFLVIHAVNFQSHEFRTTELNLFVGRNFLVTHHREPLRSVHQTLERIQKNDTAVARASDRLAYTILDLLFDNYDPALADLNGDIARLENAVLENHISRDVLGRVLALKGEVQRLRQIIFPQRDVFARIARREFKVVRAHLLPYYRDLLDRVNRIIDHADNYRDALTNTLQVHLNIQQTQVNHVIKVLTVLATLSMPMLIITSFYGMNIRHFPNADWPEWPQAYAIMFGLFGFFTWIVYWLLKRKKWM